MSVDVNGNGTDSFTISADGYLAERAEHDGTIKLLTLAPDIDALAVEAVRMIVRSYAVFHQEVGPNRTAHGISDARYGVLRVLFEASGTPLTMSQIARKLTVTQTHVTQLIAGLERDGLVERWPDSRDRRVTRVGLTPAGQERLAAAAPHEVRRFEELMSGLSQQEKRILIHLLAKVRLMMLTCPDEPYTPGPKPILETTA